MAKTIPLLPLTQTEEFQNATLGKQLAALDAAYTQNVSALDEQLFKPEPYADNKQWIGGRRAFRASYDEVRAQVAMGNLQRRFGASGLIYDEDAARLAASIASGDMVPDENSEEDVRKLGHIVDEWRREIITAPTTYALKGGHAPTLTEFDLSTPQGLTLGNARIYRDGNTAPYAEVTLPDPDNDGRIISSYVMLEDDKDSQIRRATEDVQKNRREFGLQRLAVQERPQIVPDPQLAAMGIPTTPDIEASLRAYASERGEEALRASTQHLRALSGANGDAYNLSRQLEAKMKTPGYIDKVGEGGFITGFRSSVAELAASPARMAAGVNALLEGLGGGQDQPVVFKDGEKIPDKLQEMADAGELVVIRPVDEEGKPTGETHFRAKTAGEMNMETAENIRSAYPRQSRAEFRDTTWDRIATGASDQALSFIADIVTGTELAKALTYPLRAAAASKYAATAARVGQTLDDAAALSVGATAAGEAGGVTSASIYLDALTSNANLIRNATNFANNVTKYSRIPAAAVASFPPSFKIAAMSWGEAQAEADEWERKGDTQKAMQIRDDAWKASFANFGTSVGAGLLPMMKLMNNGRGSSLLKVADDAMAQRTGWETAKANLFERVQHSATFGGWSAANTISSNVFARQFYDEHRDVFEGVPEATAIGLIHGFAFARMTGIFNPSELEGSARQAKERAGGAQNTYRDIGEALRAEADRNFSGIVPVRPAEEVVAQDADGKWIIQDGDTPAVSGMKFSSREEALTHAAERNRTQFFTNLREFQDRIQMSNEDIALYNQTVATLMDGTAKAAGLDSERLYKSFTLRDRPEGEEGVDSQATAKARFRALESLIRTAPANMLDRLQARLEQLRAEIGLSVEQLPPFDPTRGTDLRSRLESRLRDYRAALGIPDPTAPVRENPWAKMGDDELAAAIAEMENNPDPAQKPHLEEARETLANRRPPTQTENSQTETVGDGIADEGGVLPVQPAQPRPEPGATELSRSQGSKRGETGVSEPAADQTPWYKNKSIPEKEFEHGVDQELANLDDMKAHLAQRLKDRTIDPEEYHDTMEWIENRASELLAESAQRRGSSSQAMRGDAAARILDIEAKIKSINSKRPELRSKADRQNLRDLQAERERLVRENRDITLKQGERELPAARLGTSNFREEGTRPGELRFKKPVQMKDGSRLSGFTDKSQKTFYGYDKNGEEFTLRVGDLNRDNIAENTGNKTADELRSLQQSERQRGDRQSKPNRGAIFMPADQNRVIIETYLKGDPTTFLHEVTHGLHLIRDDSGRSLLEIALGNQRDAFNKWATQGGAKYGSVEYFENVAKGMERYLMEGKAPAAGLEKPFARLSRLFKSVYSRLRLSGPQLSEEARAGYDRLFTNLERQQEGEAGPKVSKDEAVRRLANFDDAGLITLNQIEDPQFREMLAEIPIYNEEGVPLPPNGVRLTQGPSTFDDFRTHLFSAGEAAKRKADLVSRAPGTAAKYEEILPGWLRSRGLLPDSASEIKTRAQGLENAINHKSALISDKLNVAINEALGLPPNLTNFQPGALNNGVRQQRAAMMRRVNEYLLGGSHPWFQSLPRPRREAIQQRMFNALPDNVKPFAAEARAHVDSLSRALIAVGAVQGGMAGIVDANRNFYLHRSYQFFDDPMYSARLKRSHPEIYTDAMDYFIRSGRTAEEARADVEYLLNPNNFVNATAEDGAMRWAIDRKATSILKHRDDIPAAIRKLWGEYTDPLINYAKTVAKQAQMVSTHQMYLEMVNDGVTNGWMSATPTAQLNEMIFATEGGKSVRGRTTSRTSPIAGYYTTPEIASVFREIEKAGSDVSSKLMAGMARFNWWSKNAKFVLNPGSHVRNFMGASMLYLMNGHGWSRRALGEAGRSAQAHMADVLPEWWVRAAEGKLLDRASAENEAIRLRRLGIIGDHIQIGGMVELHKQFAKAKAPDDLSALGTTDKVLSFLEGGLKKGQKFAELAIQTEDSFWKALSFYSEYRNLRAALPDHGPNAVSNRDVEFLAAKRVRDTMPSYDKTPALAKFFQKNPIIGTFVSFQAEMIRNGYNMAKYAIQDMNTPGMRAHGVRRMAGLLTGYLAMGAAANAMTKLVTGWWMDDEDDQAARMFDPPWDKDATKVYTAFGDGKASFINMSYTFPSSWLTDAFTAYTRYRTSGEEIDAAAVESLRKMFAPYMNWEFSAKLAMDVWANKDDFGRRIYNPQDTLLGKAQDVGARALQSVTPGFVNQIQQVFKDTTVNGTPFQQSASGLVGLRIATRDFRKALPLQTTDVLNSLAAADDLFEDAFNTAQSEEELKAAFDQMTARRAVLFSHASQIYYSAIRTGIPANEAKKIMDDAVDRNTKENLSKKELQAIIYGYAPPYQLSEHRWELLKKKDPARAASILAITGQPVKKS